MEISKEQINRLSEIFSGLGHIMVGSVVIPYLIGTFNRSYSIGGTMIAIACWGLSLYIVRKRL